MQTYQTIQLREQRGVVHIRICRPEAANSLNATLIRDIRTALLHLEDDGAIKVVVLEGSAEHFCTGMDLEAVSDARPDALFEDDPGAYYELLRQLSRSSKVIISKVEGRVNAGGVGLVAASDIVLAHHEATFGLSEALLGLLPACVLPFLIRRVGYQPAKRLALITQSIPAQRAYELGLVDEVSANINDTLRRNLLRLTKLDTGTIGELKSYMDDLWMISEATQRLAVDKFSSLMNTPKVQENIRRFVQNGTFPWE